MAKLTWEVIHECDMDDGMPTEWCAELPTYGYVWIDLNPDNRYEVVISKERGEDGSLINACYVTCVVCSTLASAKRWAARYL